MVTSYEHVKCMALEVAFAEKIECIAWEMSSIAGKECHLCAQLYNQSLCLGRVLVESDRSLILGSHDFMVSLNVSAI